jgi:hypothetical protein
VEQNGIVQIASILGPSFTVDPRYIDGLRMARCLQFVKMLFAHLEKANDRGAAA